MSEYTQLPPLPPYEEWPQANDGRFAVPNVVIDSYMSVLKPSTFLVFCFFCQQGWPAHRKDRPSNREIMDGTGISPQTLGRAIKELRSYNLIPPTRMPQHGGVPSDLRWQVWDEDNFTCVMCGSRRDLTIDHIIPVVKGGSDDRNNLQTLCRGCNSRKSDIELERLVLNER